MQAEQKNNSVLKLIMSYVASFVSILASVILFSVFLGIILFVLYGGDYKTRFSNLTFFASGISYQIFTVAISLVAIYYLFGKPQLARIKIKLIDPLLGLLLLLPTIFVLYLFQLVLSQFVETDSELNTAVISDNIGTIWIYPALFLAIIGAPISEEIFYRGLSLKLFESIGIKFLNSKASLIFATIISSAFFAIVHTPDEFVWENLVVLWTTTFILACVFCIYTIYFDRIGPSVFVHLYFNSVNIISIFNNQ